MAIAAGFVGEFSNDSIQYNCTQAQKDPHSDKSILTIKTNELNSNTNESKRQTRGCAFCNKTNHITPSCKKFLEKSMRERWKSVRKLGLCYICLESGHLRKYCNMRNCSRCDRSHNELLHFYPKNDNDRKSMGQNNSNQNHNSKTTNKKYPSAESATITILDNS